MQIYGFLIGILTMLTRTGDHQNGAAFQAEAAAPSAISPLWRWWGERQRSSIPAPWWFDGFYEGVRQKPLIRDWFLDHGLGQFVDANLGDRGDWLTELFVAGTRSKSPAFCRGNTP